MEKPNDHSPNWARMRILYMTLPGTVRACGLRNVSREAQIPLTTLNAELARIDRDGLNARVPMAHVARIAEACGITLTWDL